MPNQIIEDVLCTGIKFADTVIECPVDREILLADYDRQIFKIVRTSLQHYITQKYVNGSKLIIEGFFRISVFYQPPAGANITAVTKKVPFTKQIDLSETVARPYYVVVRGQRRYVNTRAVNPTRVDIHGIYNLSVQGYCTGHIPFATAVNSADVCTDTQTVTCFALQGRGSRQFSLEEDIPLSGQREKILDISVKNTDMELTAYDDKVNIKGSVTAEILYTAANSSRLNKHRKIFSFNQVADVPGCKENSICYGDINVLGFTVTLNTDTKGINCIFSATADIQAFGKTEVVAVCDGFSKKYRYESEKDSLEYDANIFTVNKNISVSVEDTVPDGYEACHGFARISAPQVYMTDNSPVLKSKINVNVIVKSTDGEYDCFTKNEDVYFKIGTDIRVNSRYIITAAVKECTPVLTSDRMKVKIDLMLQGYEVSVNTLSKLKYFEENTDKPATDKENALILYYGEKGENLFDIAHRYKTDTGIIKSENSIEGKTLTENKMLFIPAYGV